MSAADSRRTTSEWLKENERGRYKAPANPTLLTPPTGQYKMVKGVKRGYYSFILNLAPANEAGLGTLCPWAGACALSCIAGAGQNAMTHSRNARKWRTVLLKENPLDFYNLLHLEIKAGIKAANTRGLHPTFRLNGLSDLDWSEIADHYEGEATMYDYTKSSRRALRMKAEHPHYHLTYSWSERCREANEVRRVKQFLREGGNVAVVFSTDKGRPLPEYFMGYEVVDADADDLRFLDPPGTISGLRFKAAKNKKSKRQEAIDAGFCIEVDG